MAGEEQRRGVMGKGRLEAFSDGVIAIIITIMVLELKLPHGADLGALCERIPVFVAYVLSFVYVGLYWNNHHHLFHAVRRIDGTVLWANLHVLFWLSLIPFVTEWAGEYHEAALPAAGYGVVLALAAIAWRIMVRRLIVAEGHESKVKAAVGRDLKGRMSIAIYLPAIGLAFVHPWLADGFYALVALWWIVPDRRIEKVLAE